MGNSIKTVKTINLRGYPLTSLMTMLELPDNSRCLLEYKDKEALYINYIAYKNLPYIFLVQKPLGCNQHTPSFPSPGGYNEYKEVLYIPNTCLIVVDSLAKAFPDIFLNASSKAYINSYIEYARSVNKIWNNIQESVG